MAVLLHRLGLMTSDIFGVVILVGGAMAALAVLAALVALARLWWSGDKGWGLALAGMAFGLICLLPYGFYGQLALRYPPVTDIATADRATMPLLFDPAMASMPPPKMLSTAEMAAIFPNVERRTYPLGLVPTFAVVQDLVAGHGWQIGLLREPAPGLDVGQLNARVVTLPGWREEVVIRVTGTDTNSVVDMRSASLNAQHDFGANGQRIENFLAVLDDTVTTLLRDNPNVNTPLEAAPEAAAAD
jgi:hypothetical protein